MPQETADPVSSFLTDLGSKGVWFKPAGTHTAVVGYLPDESDAKCVKESILHYLDELRELGLPLDGSEVGLRTIKAEDWTQGWKKSFKPILVTDDIVILPDWDRSEFPDKIAIRIKPGMAFGTGDHATTKLCIRAIKRFLKPNDRILDVGCGSGILSIASAKLGASYALGLDIDRDAIENARENLALNDARGIVEVRLGTANASISQEHFDVAVANINRVEIVESYDKIEALVEAGGVLIFSGIPDGEEGYMADFFKRQQLKEVEVTREKEWVC
ncbi:MAG: 50S ribosomal protein L11 methyltransferase, partial [Candidatus Zixiibacteriota bacterium]